MENKLSASDEEELAAINSWKNNKTTLGTVKVPASGHGDSCYPTASSSNQEVKKQDLLKRFQAVREKSQEIRHNSAIRQQKTEERRTKRLIKRATRDPEVKKLVVKEEENCDDCSDKDDSEDPNKAQWQDIKPFLNINEHIAGPVPHSGCGPKTELESTIDDCIKEGDFEMAEMISDNLANKQFSAKITKAVGAKRYSEELAVQEKMRKAKKMKKLRWGFEPKQKWQMKGNM